MGKTHGYRRGTRDMFSKKFRTKGMACHCVMIIYCTCVLITGPVHLSTYLRVYKVGDRVDIKVGIIISGWVSR